MPMPKTSINISGVTIQRDQTTLRLSRIGLIPNIKLIQKVINGFSTTNNNVDDKSSNTTNATQSSKQSSTIKIAIRHLNILHCHQIGSFAIAFTGLHALYAAKDSAIRGRLQCLSACLSDSPR
jgi:hypothetical protein